MARKKECGDEMYNRQIPVDKANNPCNDMLWYMMQLNGVSFRELSRRLDESYNCIFTSMHRDMKVGTFLKYLNAIGCDLIIRNHEQNEGEWKIGDGVRLHENYGKGTSRKRKGNRAAEGDIEEKSEDIRREEG